MDKEEVWEEFSRSLFYKRFNQEINHIKDIFDIICCPEDELTEDTLFVLESEPEILESWIYCKDNPSIGLLHAIRFSYSDLFKLDQEHIESFTNLKNQKINIKDTFAIYGLLPGEIGSKSSRRRELKEVLDIVNYINPELLKILELAGKIKTKEKKSKIRTKGQGRHKLKGVTFSSSIQDMDLYEARMLDNELTEIITLKNYASGQMRVREYEGEETLSKGPLILIEDVSASMMGQPEMWAKALSLAIMRSVASLHRPVYYLQFEGEASQPKKIINKSIKNILRVIINNESLASGTNFEQPISRALEVLNKDKRCDILFITDGLGDPLKDSTINKIKEFSDLQIIGIMIISRYTDTISDVLEDRLMEFCTSVHEVQEFSPEEAVKILHNLNHK